MKRVFVNWELWECYKNGMYRPIENDAYWIEKTLFFMSNTEKFAKAMGLVIVEWENTMLHNLSNSSINKKAFLGQCACCYSIKSPESIVRICWKLLTEQQRIDADFYAQKLINNYISKIDEKENN